MSISSDVVDGVNGVLTPPWSNRIGSVVPTTDNIVLRDGSVTLDATYLYADLANSSALGQNVKPEVAAKIIRCYLNAATRILTYYGGEIRSFDGDRVMAIFVGNAKNSSAVRSGLALNWAVREVLDAAIKSQWSDITNYWLCHHGVGIDTGEALLVRGGVRNNNDLISIGAAPNVAAKLSALRHQSDIYITAAVYQNMQHDRIIAADGRNMWTQLNPLQLTGKTYVLYGSAWWWKP